MLERDEGARREIDRLLTAGKTVIIIPIKDGRIRVLEESRKTVYKTIDS